MTELFGYRAWHSGGATAVESKEQSAEERLRADFEKLPQHIQRQVGAGFVEGRETTTIHDADSGTSRVDSTAGKLNLPATDSNMDRLNAEFTQAHAELAAAAPGSEAARKAELRVKQIEASARLQQQVNAEHAEETGAKDRAEIAELEDALDLQAERHGMSIHNIRRAKYGLPPLGKN